MSDPENQSSPEYREAVQEYMARQDPGVGLVFLFFCSIYVGVFFVNVMVFKRLFGYKLGQEPLKINQNSSFIACVFNVINVFIILILLICLCLIIYLLVNYGVVGRDGLALWSILLLVFIRPTTEYYAFYIVIATRTKYNSQYKFDSNAENVGKSRMVFWGVALIVRELVLYFCNGYFFIQYPDPKYVLAVQSGAIVLIVTFISLHVLLLESVRLRWKMFRGKIVVTNMDKFIFSQAMLLSIFKTALLLAVLLAMLTGSDIGGLIQCYYTADILLVATVFLLSEVLSTERNREGIVYVDPDTSEEEPKI